MERKINMKIITTILISMICNLVSAQVRSIPAEVTEAFKEKYPNAKMVTWKDNLSNYEADFTDASHKFEVKFNSKGEWLETARKIEFDELNDDIKDGFKKSKYTDWQIRGVKEIVAFEKPTLYRILVRKNDLEKKYLFFDKKGQLKRESLTL